MKFLLFMSFFIPLSAFADTSVKYICEKNVTCDKNFWQVVTTDSQEPVSGKVIDYFKNGKIHFEGYFKEGKPEGLNKIYYENGQLEREGSFKDGQFSGINKWYNQNGTLRFVRNYQENGRHSEFNYINGKIYSESNYFNSMKDGPQRKYYLDGQLKYEYNYKNNQLDGIQKEYDSQGNLISEKTYENGVERRN